MLSDMIKDYKIPLNNRTIEKLREIFQSKRKQSDSEIIQKTIYEYLDVMDILGGNSECNPYEENQLLALMIQRFPSIEKDLIRDK